MLCGICEAENNRTEILNFLTFIPIKRGLSYNILSKQKPSEQLPELPGEPGQFSFLASSMQRKGRKKDSRERRSSSCFLGWPCGTLNQLSWCQTQTPPTPGVPGEQPESGTCLCLKKKHLVGETDYAAQPHAHELVVLLFLLLCVTYE